MDFEKPLGLHWFSLTLLTVLADPFPIHKPSFLHMDVASCSVLVNGLLRIPSQEIYVSK